MAKYCCDDFANNVEGPYDESYIIYDPPGRWEEGYDGWNIRGCCGHCNVVSKIKYCPFCGKELETPEAIDG